jgi:CheY-like chemotaxis protein
MPYPTAVVVDDDTDYLTFITTLLALNGYTVLPCRQSQEAASLIRARQPDVVLLDLRMEHMHSGLEVLATLRAESATRHVPVLICSADAVAIQSLAKTRHEPQTAVLAKPFELSDLMAALTHLTRT